jgi:hypothetical protein
LGGSVAPLRILIFMAKKPVFIGILHANLLTFYAHEML